MYKLTQGRIVVKQATILQFLEDNVTVLYCISFNHDRICSNMRPELSPSSLTPDTALTYSHKDSYLTVRHLILHGHGEAAHGAQAKHGNK